MKVLKEGWCYRAEKLTKIIISLMNDKLILKENKYLFGKSDPNNDEIQYIIISHNELKIESEDSLFDIISQIIKPKKIKKLKTFCLLSIIIFFLEFYSSS